MTIERVLTILAALLVIAATILLWYDNVSVAFVTGTLSAVAWFVGYRFRLRASMPTDDDDAKDANDNEEEM